MTASKAQRGHTDPQPATRPTPTHSAAPALEDTTVEALDRFEAGIRAAIREPIRELVATLASRDIIR